MVCIPERLIPWNSDHDRQIMSLLKNNDFRQCNIDGFLCV